MKKLCLSLSLLAMLACAPPATADAKFEAFIESLWPKIKSAGYSRELFDAAFEGISEPNQSVLKLAKTQPEFTSTTSAYLSKAVTPIRIESGQAKKSEEAALLKAIEKKYAVDYHIVLGIWGMESNYGKDKGSISVMQALATLMYAGTPSRKKYAQGQLIEAFKILKRGSRTPDNFVGSWAAAMGHTQFIPGSYNSLAVDWTGDGKRDIWNSKEDALASTANYLAKNGWQNDRPWGWEVALPKGFNRALIGRGNRKPVSAWMEMGITRADGRSFGNKAASAFVMIPQGIEGPAFLVTKNFEVIMTYNISHSYALGVGHLADRIRGLGPIQGEWPEVSTDLSFAERVETQKRLSALGFETGGSDGRFGARTYEAVIAFQRKAGIAMDGKPTRKLLERLRKGG